MELEAFTHTLNGRAHSMAEQSWPTAICSLAKCVSVHARERESSRGCFHRDEKTC